MLGNDDGNIAHLFENAGWHQRVFPDGSVGYSQFAPGSAEEKEQQRKQLGVDLMYYTAAGAAILLAVKKPHPITIGTAVLAGFIAVQQYFGEM